MKRAPLVAILLGYAVLAALVQVHCIDLLTSDGECYLRIAVYTAHGDFRHAIFGHWSPLGSWLTVPLVLAGMVPRYAFRVMIGLWGAAAIVGVWRVAGRFGLSGAWRAAATACAAVLAAEFSAEHRVDLLITALLLFYLDAVMDQRLLTSWRWAAWTGALGGVAYLAKLYALPFFAVHYTLMVLAHGWRGAGGSRKITVGSRQKAVGRKQETESDACLTADCFLPTADRARAPRSRWRAMAIAWVAGVALFALVAEPWVMALTLKYGRLTAGTAAAQTYAQFGPGAGDTRHWAITGLRTPPADAYSVWQDADFDLPDNKKPTSLLRSRPAFSEQMRTVRRNLGVMLSHFAGLDRLRLGVAALALTPLACLLAWKRRDVAFRHLTVALTVAVFCGGYAFIHADDERFFWFPFLLVPPVTFHFVALAAGWARRRMPRMRERGARLLAAALALVAVGSFVDPAFGIGQEVVDGCKRVLALDVEPATHGFFRELFGSPPPGREHRLVARQLAEWGVRGPLAAMGHPHGLYRPWHDGLHTAYYLDAQYAGMPAARTPDRIVIEMRAAGARTLLVWGDPPLAESLRAMPALRRVGVIRAESLPGLEGDVAVFELRQEVTLQPSEARDMGLLLAPRGRNGIAQGEALGKGQPRVQALKGRDIDFCFAAKRESTLRFSSDSGGPVTPLQGFVGYRSSFPGLRPGLFHHALSGLRTDVLRAFCLHSVGILRQEK